MKKLILVLTTVLFLLTAKAQTEGLGNFGPPLNPPLRTIHFENGALPLGSVPIYTTKGRYYFKIQTDTFFLPKLVSIDSANPYKLLWIGQDSMVRAFTPNYLTSFTESDPLWTASPSFGITGTNITNWNTAFGWGNHATAGYQLVSNLQTNLTTSSTKYPNVDAVNTGLGLKENSITAGTTSQYWRGDKTFQTLDKIAVGLPNVDNTSDLNKPISTATQTALNTKQPTITTGTTAQYFRGDLSLATFPSFPGTTNFPAYSAGTVYTLTTTSQKVDFGTTDPVITITTPGTYLIFTNLKIEYAGVTTALNACNFKLRRTNNTAADLTNATTNFNVPVLTLATGTGGDVDISVIIYTTANSNDVIELWGSRSGGLTLGAINIGEASVVAVRIF